MNNLLNKINSSTKQDLRILIQDAQPSEIKRIFEYGPQHVIDRILVAADHELLNKILPPIESEILQNALSQASSKAISYFLKGVSHKQISRIVSNANDELVEKLINLADSKSSITKIIKHLPFPRKTQWMQYVSSQENYLKQIKSSNNEVRISLMEESEEQLDELKKSIIEQRKLLDELIKKETLQKRASANRLKDISQQLTDIEAAYQNKKALLEESDEELKKRTAELKELENKKVQERIEKKVPEYVENAVKILEDREKQYRKKAFYWGLQGIIVLFVAISATASLSLYGYAYGEKLSSLGWQTLIFISLKGLIILGVLGLWAKHAFTVSNAYMHEAIKRTDRAHAINFGKLYLEVYGNTVDRKELVDIFENWNITSESAFLKASPDSFEPKVLEKIAEMLKSSEQSKIK